MGEFSNAGHSFTEAGHFDPNEKVERPTPEILVEFRGKKIEDGKWTYGYLFKIWEKCFILWGTTQGIPNMEEVDPKTVGQKVFEKRGHKYYVGDVARVKGTKQVGGYLSEIIVTMQGFSLAENRTYLKDDKCFIAMDGVAGNIHDGLPNSNN